MSNPPPVPPPLILEAEHQQQHQHHQQPAFAAEEEEDWEEWDGKSPFWIHCAAGSFAGVMEHTLVFPLDTVRTHIQVCASCVHRHPSSSVRHNHHSNMSTTPTGIPRSKLPSSSSGATSAASHVLSSSSLRGLVTNTAEPQFPHSHANYAKLPTGFWQTMRFLMNEPQAAAAAASTVEGWLPTPLSSSSSAASPVQRRGDLMLGWTRLWRGIQAIFIGCIPAHALYFSSYEMVKAACARTTTTTTTTPNYANTNASSSSTTTTTTTTTRTTWWGSSLAGAAAVLSHDMVMTPLDTIKQRMQLGHYASAFTALREIVGREGWAALYRSFPITLVTNVPYGMVMVTTHETCKQILPVLLSSWWSSSSSKSQHQQPHNNNDSSFGTRPTTTPSWVTIFLASSVGGFTASAVTTPLDRIKTALQTQTLAPACLVNPTEPCHATKAAAAAATTTTTTTTLAHSNWQQAARFIYATEGWRGFCRGFWPRVLSHTPAVAISWTTYECTKQMLLQHYHYSPLSSPSL